MTRIKICGVTREEDALLCAELGADFIGFVFVEESKRYVTPERAAAIVRSLWSGGLSARRNELRRAESPPLHRIVGVFRDASPAYVRAVAATVGLDLAQLHGEETNEDIADIGLPVIKASLDPGAPHPAAAWLLFDTPGGGTGRTFDWSALSAYPRTKPFFLAGGLNPDNIADAIRLVRPDGVDVSSGVESSPGIKDPHKLKAFIERARTT